jgi:phosphodiesterase/alkaline phosphatase D-like protein
MNRNAKLATLALLAVAAVLPTPLARAASSPAVISGAVTAKTSSTAILHGTVNPDGAATEYSFEWGVTDGYGTGSPSSPAGHGEKDLAVETKVEGLLPGTTYHYRLVASNKFGGAAGADRSFRTKGHPPPGATTGPASQVGLRQATVTGSIEPSDAETGYSFQYGLTSAYGLQTSVASVSAGSAPVPVSAQLAGLAPGTAFHYRIVAQHGPIVTYGADAIFVTLPLRQQVVHLRAKTAPRRNRRRPFRFITTGRLRGAGSLPASARCTGSVAVAFRLRKRKVAFRLVPLQPDCTFSAHATVLRRLSKKARRHRRLRLRVAVRFRGNAYLSPARARSEHVRIVRARHRRRH